MEFEHFSSDEAESVVSSKPQPQPRMSEVTQESVGKRSSLGERKLRPIFVQRPKESDIADGPKLLKQKSGILSIKTLSRKKNKSFRTLRQMKSRKSLNGEVSGLTLRSPREGQDKINIKKKPSYFSEVSNINEKIETEDLTHKEFAGTWVSNEVDINAFMDELNLDARYQKLALNFGGDVSKSIKIWQKGPTGSDIFIEERTQRRVIKYRVVVGEEFEFLNEQEQTLRCKTSWFTEAGSKRRLKVEQYNPATESTILKVFYIEDNKLIEKTVTDDKESFREYNKKQ
eukprot:snap_masked-scaffold_5-processed-gene-20.38-mRNA-1 protein AED:1.00 eAED:1.00 QI:0/-1/0/0/-1/1/1/0/285